MPNHHFISYSTIDALDFSLKLCDALAAGPPSFHLWLNKRQLRPGEDWDEQIVEAIKTCESLLFVMTADSVQANSVCKQEWTRALKYKKHVIPIRLHTDAELPFRLEPRQFIDFATDFETGLAKLRTHLQWLSSPGGVLQALKYRLADAQRDLQREKDPQQRTRIQDDLAELQKQISEQQRVVDDPEAARERVAASIAAGLEREREPQRPSTGAATAKFINPPPMTAPSYFQDRYVETKLLADFLRDDSRCMFTLVGRGGTGKTALACRLLKALEHGHLPDDLGALQVDGIVYLSAVGTRRVNVPDLYSDLLKLLPPATARELEAVYKNPQASTDAKMRPLLQAFAHGRFVVLLDNFEDVVHAETLGLRDAELEEALTALLQAPAHAIKVIITTRLAPRPLALVQPSRQMRLDLDEGLASPYAENILREMDRDGKLGLKTASDELLAEARFHTRGFPRALEALFAILSADRDTTFREVLDNVALRLPENVLPNLVGEAFSRLDSTAQKVMQSLAVYGHPVPATAVDYLLQDYLPNAKTDSVLARLVRMQLVQKQNERYYLHPVSRAYAFARIPRGEEFDRFMDQPPFTQLALLHRSARYFERFPDREQELSASSAIQSIRIFISYRRDDSAGHAGRLHDRLVAHLGHNRVFMDIESIELGADFVEVIKDAVSSCDVLIAIIGRQWLTLTDEAGRRRIDNPDDFVRIEISTALSKNIRVIPCLVQNVSMPKQQYLPEQLGKLATRNALEISEKRFHQDVDKLINALAMGTSHISETEQRQRNNSANTAKFSAPNVIKTLVDEAFFRLDPTEQKVIQSLATYNRSVPSAAVDYLLQPFVTGVNSVSVFNRLVNLHFVHQEAGRYHLHPMDREYALSRVPRGEVSDREVLDDKTPFTQIALADRGANYFAETRLPRANWKTLADLAPQLAEIDLRCVAEDYDTAATVLVSIDFDYLLLWGHYHLMIELHERLQGILDDPNLKSVSLGNLGTAYWSIGQVQRAIACYEQALALARELNNRRAEGAWLGYLGKAHADLSQISKAVEYNEQALAISREIGDRFGEGTYLDNLGNCYLALGQASLAIEYHEKALAIDREIGDRRGEGIDLGNLGICYSAIGQTVSAIEYHEQALAISRQIGDRRNEGNQLGNLGNCSFTLGRIAQASEHYEQALAIAREIGDRRGEGTALGNLGNCYTDLGQTTRAIEYYEQALMIARDIDDRLGEGRQVGNLGLCYSALGQINHAIEYLKQALAIRREIGDRRGEGMDLGNLALVLTDQEGYQDAIRLALECVKIGNEINSPFIQSNGNSFLALAHLYANDLSTARAVAETARKYDEPQNNHNILALLGVIAFRQADQSAAQEAFAAAVQHAEQMLAHSAQNYAALDAKGLALSGLALCEGPQHVAAAIAAYRAARAINQDAGIVKRVLRLFDELAKADEQGILQAVRAAAAA